MRDTRAIYHVRSLFIDCISMPYSEKGREQPSMRQPCPLFFFFFHLWQNIQQRIPANVGENQDTSTKSLDARLNHTQKEEERDEMHAHTLFASFSDPPFSFYPHLQAASVNKRSIENQLQCIFAVFAWDQDLVQKSGSRLNLGLPVPWKNHKHE